MKNLKLKVLVATLAVCLVALGSLSTLAWFTAEDSVTNNFQIAESTDDADGIFSVDVWEKDEDGNIKDSIIYPDIQPGDDLYKEVNIENTGYYDQYIRATVTITGADVWFDVYDEVFFDLANFATDLNPAFTVDRVEFNLDTNEVIYTLYYNDVLKSGDVVNLFTNVHVAEALDQYQAAELVGNNFNIKVVATAVQTANVGDNAIEAFKTVEMYKEAGEYLVVTTAEGAIRGIAAGILNGIPVDVSFDFTDGEDDVLTLDPAKPYFHNNGNLVIEGGIINAANASNYGLFNNAGSTAVYNDVNFNFAGGGIVARDGANVTINGGSIAIESASTSHRHMIFATGEGTVVTINEGNFSFDSYRKRTYGYVAAGAVLYINGGTFGKAPNHPNDANAPFMTDGGEIIITGGTFGFNPSAWVAAGYVANYDATAKTWTVVAE